MHREYPEIIVKVRSYYNIGKLDEEKTTWELAAERPGWESTAQRENPSRHSRAYTGKLPYIDSLTQSLTHTYSLCPLFTEIVIILDLELFLCPLFTEIVIILDLELFLCPLFTEIVQVGDVSFTAEPGTSWQKVVLKAIEASLTLTLTLTLIERWLSRP